MYSISFKIFYDIFVTSICVNTIFFKFERVKWDHYISLQLSQTGKLQCRHTHTFSLSLFQHHNLVWMTTFWFLSIISLNYSFNLTVLWRIETNTVILISEFFFTVHLKFCSRMRRCLHWPFPVAAAGSASSWCFVFYPYNACFETTLVSPSGLAQSFLLTVLSWGRPVGG